MSIKEYREKIEEIKKFLLFANKRLDESLCCIDGDIDKVNDREIVLSRLNLLCARDHVKMADHSIFEVVTAEIEFP